jgi:starch synthase (maltosyl-transferring)
LIILDVSRERRSIDRKESLRERSTADRHEMGSVGSAPRDGTVAYTPESSADIPNLSAREAELRRRVVIENVRPQVDEGRFPAKRVVGDRVVVEADIYADGHEELACNVLYRRESDVQWREAPMRLLANDRWQGEFKIEEWSTYCFTVEGWMDAFLTWQHQLQKRVDAGQEVSVDLLIGAGLVDEAARRASGNDSRALTRWAARLRGENRTDALRHALSGELAVLMRSHADRTRSTRYHKELRIAVDLPKASFSTWYEMFPRSASAKLGAHGTFRDVEKRLPYVAGMGFDVLYFPPIHPIGKTKRKGPNNSAHCKPGDPGSPWAIGSEEGGHKAIHPQLGTLAEFRRLVAKAKDMGIDIALDIAFQCSPDHPWVKEHPEWFKHRPDGSVQYAENPPKKYEDIYPINFDTENWQELWQELKSVFDFWIEQGVRIFRVDNPHTKPFSFWEWCIGEIKREHPDIIFLAEAFTRPKIMYHLAKLGFTQSYTYFAWRNSKWELSEYFTELTQTDVKDFFRPNAWPNTPDILNAYLQNGGRPAFMVRLTLAATLSSNYGIYGPAFELCERQPREPGSEEYWNSEKYEIKDWDLERPDSLSGFISTVNRIRRENPALQRNWNLRFHYVDNDQLICYSKETDDGTNVVITVVNLDPVHTQSGWVHLPLEGWGVGAADHYQVEDQLTGNRFTWVGPRNFVMLNPHDLPAHIFVLHRKLPGGGYD